MEPQDIIKFIEILQSITSKSSAHRLNTLLSPDIHFSSPFYQSTGRDNFSFAMSQIFAASDAAAPQSGRLRVTDWGAGQNGFSYYLRWDRLLYLPGGKRAAYSGMSEIMYAPDGLIASITDYYDPADAPTPKTSLITRLLAR